MKNPPAFARPVGFVGDVADEISNEQEGMSLRDYFAAHAPTLTEQERVELGKREHQKMLDDRSRTYVMRPFYDLIAERNFGYADAMLKAREAATK